MRTNDPTEPERFQPFGPKVEKPAAPASSPKPQGPSGIVTDKDGKMQTTTHQRSPLTLEQAIWDWRETYCDEYLIDFLP